MKKKEWIVIAVIVLIGCAAIFVPKLLKKENPDKYMVQVIKDNRIIDEIDSRQDGEYWYDGNYGKLMVEVKEGQWRVTQEECPNHVCSSIGFVDHENYFPIVCIPNGILVVEKEVDE